MQKAASEPNVELEEAAKARRAQRQAFVPLGQNVHLYVHSTGLGRHRAVAAEELADEITREREQHRLVRAGLCGKDPDLFLATMGDVNAAISLLADEALWSVKGPLMPSEFFIDEIGKWNLE